MKTNRRSFLSTLIAATVALFTSKSASTAKDNPDLLRKLGMHQPPLPLPAPPGRPMDEFEFRPVSEEAQKPIFVDDEGMMWFPQRGSWPRQDQVSKAPSCEVQLVSTPPHVARKGLRRLK